MVFSRQAAAGTFMLEFGVLSALTNDSQYERAARRAVRGLMKHRSRIGASPTWLISRPLAGVLRGYSEQYSGFQAVFVLYGLAIL